MTAFVVTNSSVSSDKIQRLESNYRDNGLSLAFSDELGSQTIRLFSSARKEIGGSLAFKRYGDTDWVASLGLLLANGLTGDQALDEIWNNFQPQRPNWTGLQGAFLILVRKADTLSIYSDSLNACKIYHSDDRSIMSNRFDGVLELSSHRTLDIQSCCEYVFCESVFGGKSLVNGIQSLPAFSMATTSGAQWSLVSGTSPIINDGLNKTADFEDIARDNAARMVNAIKPLADFRGDIRLQFSGGFDSRLLLACLFEVGVRPILRTHGPSESADVVIARKIAEQYDLPLEHNNAEDRADPTLQDFPDVLKKLAFASDLWSSPGIFESEHGYFDRIERCAHGTLVINGSLGEIYRNFFYLRGQPLSPMDLVSVFFCQYDPASGARLFDDKAFREKIADKICTAIGKPGASILSPQDIEAVYPLFRGQYWTARDVQLSQFFGPMFFPFLDAALISGTSEIPMAFKDKGRLEARMIQIIHPELADIEMDYGFAPSQPPPLSYRLKYASTTFRPMFLRRRTFRIKTKRSVVRPNLLTRNALKGVLDPDFPVMSAIINPAKIYDNEQFNRLATLEYMAETHDLAP